MALLRIPDEKRSLSEVGEITNYLAGMGIEYERWEPSAALAPGASAEEILAAYAPKIE